MKKTKIIELKTDEINKLNLSETTTISKDLLNDLSINNIDDHLNSLSTKELK
jgi:hypothetical protein